VDPVDGEEGDSEMLAETEGKGADSLVVAVTPGGETIESEPVFVLEDEGEAVVPVVEVALEVELRDGVTVDPDEPDAPNLISIVG
jgi:hypothetical protein